MSSRSVSPNSVLAIEVELRAEKASALKRTAHRVESLLAELAQTEQALQKAQGPARDRLVSRHRELRGEAEKHRWYLVVQREAMGLFQHDDIYEMYRLPSAVN